MSIRTIAVATLAVAIAALVADAPVSASFPGENGKIAFVRPVLTKDQIFVVNPDGSGQTRLSSKTSDRWPSWSGDGQRIAFQACCRKGNWQIWVMSSAGSGRVNVSSSAASDTHPAFSPDGTRIAFVRSGQIWVMSADGSGKTRLTAPSGFTDDAPAWSPDGTRIAFQRCCFRIPGSVPDGWQIFTMSAGGSNQRNVSSTAGTTSDFRPDWAPDGTKIVLARCVCLTTNDEIYAMSADGSGQIRLAPGVNAAEPRYSPDGSKIVFRGYIGGGVGIYTIPVGGGQPVRLTDGFEAAWQPIP